MKKPTFTDAKTAFLLRQAEAGTAIGEDDKNVIHVTAALFHGAGTQPKIYIVLAISPNRMFRCATRQPAPLRVHGRCLARPSCLHANARWTAGSLDGSMLPASPQRRCPSTGLARARR